jgi:hypothetical protein
MVYVSTEEHNHEGKLGPIHLNTKCIKVGRKRHYTQEVVLPGIHECATFELYGAQITPKLLRKLADELEDFQKEMK